MELSIALCSERRPKEAAKYSALREVVGTVFQKRNYSSFIGTDAYRKEYEELKSQLGSASDSELVEHCESLLRLLQAPPQGIIYRE